MTDIIDFGLPILEIGQTPATVNTTDLIDYVFKFPDFSSALRDSVVGPTFTSPADVRFRNKEVLVFPDTRVNSTTAQLGYWFILTTVGLVSKYQTHSNIQIVNDLTLMNLGQNSVLSSLFDTSFTSIVISNFCIYCQRLFATTPANGYVTEDGLVFYVAEDGVTFYVQES